MSTRTTVEVASSPFRSAAPPISIPVAERLRVVRRPLDEPPMPDVRSTVVSRRDAVRRRLLAAADVWAAAVALLTSMAVVGHHHPAAVTLLLAPLIVALGKVVGTYDRGEWLVRSSTLDEAPVLFQVATLYAVGAWLIDGMLITRTSNRAELLVVWVTLFVGLLVARAVARWAARCLTPAERCLVIGDEELCERMRTKLARTRSLHATVAAHIPLDRHRTTEDAMHTLARRGDLAALAGDFGVDRIIVAPKRTDAEEVLNLIRAATSLGLRVSVVPRVLEVVGSSAEFDDLEGVPLLSMRRVRLSRSSYWVKRTLDIAGSLFGMVVLSPVLAAIALAIKLDSKGTVLYRQLRIGRDGEPFQMLKFRTMVPDAHARRAELVHLNQAKGLFKIDKDPRITRVGAYLRRLSLDELPQVFNVLCGHMSLVGPRPLIAEEDRMIRGWERRRLQLTPGMTGHWQILGSARIPLEDMVKIDYLYVTNWSLWLDIKILLRTVGYMAARKGM